MVLSARDISDLVSSRICHDLISPIGAISNGVELLSDIGGPPPPELGLIGDSVNLAALKLRFFRLAFGVASGPAKVPTADLRLAVGALVRERSSIRISTAADEVPRRTAKIAFLGLLCLERALPLGGDTEVTLSDEAILIATRTSRIRDIGPLWAVVENPDHNIELAPAEVQFVLLGQILRTSGAAMRRERNDDGLTLSVTGICSE